MFSSFAPRKIKKFSKLIIIADSTITITKIERIKESVKKELEDRLAKEEGDAK